MTDLDVDALNFSGKLQDLVLGLSDTECIGRRTSSSIDLRVKVICLGRLGGFTHGVYGVECVLRNGREVSSVEGV